MATPAPRRLQRLAGHLIAPAPAPSAADADADPEPALLSWAEIQRHCMADDAWVVIDGTVYDITEFIKEDSGHPGGAEIPLEYAGKDATEFWTDMHGHLQDEILEAIDNNDPGELADLGLEAVPIVVGIADGDPPASAQGAGFPSTNWAGNILWTASEVALPESIEELQSLVREAGGRIRCVGRSHSFTPSADTDGLLMSMVRMQNVLEYDETAGTITIEGGATYTVLNQYLQVQT